MLSLDITGALAKVITPSLGIPENDLATIANTLKTYVSDFLKEREAGKHEWTALPYDRKTLDSVEAYADDVKRLHIETILWVGIGGSSLGPRVIKEVFERPDTPELIILDTIDPAVIMEELKLIRFDRTLIVIASKSGETLESMSVFFILEDLMTRELGEEKTKDRIVVITDSIPNDIRNPRPTGSAGRANTGTTTSLLLPQEGGEGGQEDEGGARGVRKTEDVGHKDSALKTHADDRGYMTLPIPHGVGGRYSIFTPIGLLPLILLGGDLSAFVRGAKDMDTMCQNPILKENPASQLAAVQFLLDTKRDYLIRVIMPYATRLQSLGRWEQQLIAESLGKTEAYGPSPMASIGTQDQHSMLQQWMQGRRVSWHLFIREEEKERISIPSVPIETLSYISGKGLGQVLDALYQGTAQSLTAAKRPHATITLPRIDEYHLGQLFFLFMVEVVLLGKLYRVDPYGQPGVEMGKKIAKGILSRSA